MFRNKIRTSDFFTALACFLVVLVIAVKNYIGIGFPEEDKLHYTTGIFHIKERPRATNHVLLSKNDTNNDNQLFSCSYSQFGNGQSSSCGDTKFLLPYVDQKVTIGWYKQDKLLGFENKLPQLVTIEMDNEMVRTYKRTAEKIKSSRKDSLYLPIFGLFISIIIYRRLGKQSANSQ